MIRKGTLTDISTIMKITRACANKMIENNIYQWNENYPYKEAFENEMRHKALPFQLIGEFTEGTNGILDHQGSVLEAQGFQHF